MKTFVNILTLNFLVFCLGFVLSCNTDDSDPIVLDNNISNTDDSPDDNSNNNPNSVNLKILSLGDSYTIGQSVCETCRFPEQLKDSLATNIENSSFELQLIAQTGWTTTNLINAIETENPSTDFDLVTLLIGVNNQYQGKPFSLYEQEFPELVNTAIDKANGDIDNVIVVSIPDYAFTPFGGGNASISQEIDQYNEYAKNYCEVNNISYVYITDITRYGLVNPELVASDNLHPSELAYSKFVERIIPVALEKI
ncbi:MAG: SGNH/GDSL hydrolase family protein [Flavobacteriaceae bacterium]|nr:SGNH/GDSL hydrolase family protein [Bacteroidia bacterium]NNL16396.1 SGNH/GDSL hydrolase family protein [Flavobacteriaceae bacterium]